MEAVARERIGLVGCVKTKRAVPDRAADLYVSTMFQGRRRYVEASCERWFILSALHRVIAPDEVIAPYEAALKTASASERRVWSEQVLAALEQRLGDLGQYDFEVHAGGEYRDFGLVDGLRHRGARVTVPAKGLSFGEQLAFYSGKPRPSEAAAIPAGAPRSAPGTSGYAAFREFLRDQRQPTVEMTFAAVERAIGRSLPASAHRHRAWWANDTSHSHASSWLDAGWRVETVDQRGQRVSFRRAAR